MVALSFFCAIAIGTLLLSLPIAVKHGNEISLIDKIFTATSATCVTGLVVKDTGSFFSTFGKYVIFALVQIGGLGIMTFSTLFAIALGRKLTLRHNVVIQKAMNQQKVQGLSELIKYVLYITVGFEMVGAILLFIRWIVIEDWSVKETLINSVFHSVSAFCNAGFSLFQTSFTAYRADPYINAIMISLIFLGGLGFVVILDLPKLFSFRSPIKRLSIQTKLALVISVLLVAIAMIFILFIEKDNVLEGMPAGERIAASFFHAVTPRTAGFNTLEVNNMLAPTIFLMLFLMFIGASPGSTGGGIKTCTFGVLMATMYSMLYNKDRVSVFRRTIPKDVVRRALVVFTLAFIWIGFVSMVLLFTEKSHIVGQGNVFLKVLFEVTSAFGTVGLSTGITPNLSFIGKVFIVLTMYLGRVGPLTIALSVALRKHKVIYTYPEERIMVG